MKNYPWQDMFLRDLPNEIWVDIKDYEGYYMVSNLGRIKSLPRLRIYKTGTEYLIEERILKISKRGYSLNTRFQVEGLYKTKSLTKLVASHFIKNYQNEPLWFKDHDRLNICAENLIPLTKNNYKPYFNHLNTEITPEMGRFMYSLGERRCSACLTIYPLDHFLNTYSKSKSRNILLSNRCMDCSYNENKERSELKKQKVQANKKKKEVKYSWQHLETDDLPNEKWVEFARFEKNYQISNKGRIKKIIKLKRNKPSEQRNQETLRKSKITLGAIWLDLFMNKKFKSINIAKAVAEHFIKGYDNQPLWYKDFDKYNIEADNLILITKDNYKTYFDNNKNRIGTKLGKLIFENGERRCSYCMKIKPIEQFAPKNKKPKSVRGYRNFCTTCVKISSKYYYELSKK